MLPVILSIFVRYKNFGCFANEIILDIKLC